MKFDITNWEHWFHGLSAAFIGGASAGVSVVVVDPAKFNIHEGWKNLLEVCLVNGIIATAAYLKSSPLPPEPTQITK